MPGRTFSLSRVRFGLPYMLLGAMLMLIILSMHPVWLLDKEISNNKESWPPVQGRRDLRNLQNPCNEYDRPRDKEKEVMIKLMNQLLDRFNRTLDFPQRQEMENYNQQKGQLKSWIPKVKDLKLNANDITSYFQVAVTPSQKIAVYDALLTLEQVSKANNFTWMLYSGTLLGSWRHHDMIPWDDDFDIFMNYTQREEVKAVLSSMGPKYQFFEAGSRMKFWIVNGTIKASDYPWQWPYLDISFFKENKTHIWDGSMEDDYGDRFYMYHKDIVFPLHPRPMGKYYFPAPRDSYAHLKVTYRAGGMNMCWTTHYSHKSESLTDKVHKIMCHELKEYYPFVYRTANPSGKGIRETLKLNDREIHSVVIQEPTYALTEPYAVALL